MFFLSFLTNVKFLKNGVLQTWEISENLAFFASLAFYVNFGNFWKFTAFLVIVKFCHKNAGKVDIFESAVWAIKVDLNEKFYLI